MAYRSLPPADQARLRSDDHRLQPGGHVRGRSHPPRADDVSRRVLRHRRVHHPQGVRLVEDRRRDREPARTRRSIGCSTSPARSGSSSILHNDVDMPFPKPGQDPYQVVQLRDLFKRHPKTTIIWAHAGLGRVVRPVEGSARASWTARLANPELKNVYFDLSWDEVAKYIVAIAGGDPGDRRSDQPLSRPLPVRHRRSRADRPAEIPEGLRHVRAAARGAARPTRARSSARATTSGSSTRRGGRCARGKRPTRADRPARVRAPVWSRCRRKSEAWSPKPFESVPLVEMLPAAASFELIQLQSKVERQRDEHRPRSSSRRSASRPTASAERSSSSSMTRPAPSDAQASRNAARRARSNRRPDAASGAARSASVYPALHDPRRRQKAVPYQNQDLPGLLP